MDRVSAVNPENCREEKGFLPLQAKSLYVSSKGEVTDPVIKLLGLTGIRILNGKKIEPHWPKAKIYLKSRTLEDIVPATQGKGEASISWLGDPSKERWEEDPTKPNLSPSQARSIIRICMEDLQQGEAILPQDTPQAILFLGAALFRVRLRLAYLNELYDGGKLSPSLPVYGLTGERKLDEEIGETLDNLMNPHNGIIPFRKDWVPPQNIVLDEGKMLELVFSQSRHLQLDPRNIHFVYSPKDQERRATTESTVKQWLIDYSPPGGFYIAISNQPYIFYQECVIRRTLLQSARPDIYVKVIGPGIKINMENDDQLLKQARDFLNNNSRILYELLKIRGLEKNKSL